MPVAMENQSSFNTTQDQDQEMPNKDIIISVYFTLMVLSLIGNTLIILVVMLNKNLRTDFNYLIVNMAVSDLLASTVGLPVAIAEMNNNGKWIMDGLAGVLLCKLLPFLIDLSAPVSTYSLVAISINRFLASVYPVRQKTLTINLNRILMAISWIVPIGFFSPYFFVNVINSRHICGSFSFSQSQLSIYFRINTTFFFIIPLSMITVLYSAIVIKVKKSSAVLNEMLNAQQLQRRRRMSRQIFCLSIVLIGAFVILWGPFQVMLMLISFNMPAKKSLLKYDWVMMLLAYTTIVVNPSICFIFFNNYRNGLKNVFLRIIGKYEEEPITRACSLGQTSGSGGGKTRVTTAL